jgi:hypothetical protein
MSVGSSPQGSVFRSRFPCVGSSSCSTSHHSQLLKVHTSTIGHCRSQKFRWGSSLHQICNRHDRVFFVLRSFHCALLTWPARRITDGLWELDANLGAPEWNFDYKIDNWNVLFTEVQSPLHRWLSGERDLPHMAWRSDRRMGVIDWQVEHGFPAMSEAVLKNVVASFGIDPEAMETKANTDVAIELKVAAMKHHKPDWTDVDITTALRKGFIMESRDTSSDWYLDPELIDDVVLPGDRAEIKNYMKDLKVVESWQTPSNALGGIAFVFHRVPLSNLYSQGTPCQTQ